MLGSLVGWIRVLCNPTARLGEHIPVLDLRSTKWNGSKLRKRAGIVMRLELGLRPRQGLRTSLSRD